jgi:hypothetical protein
LKKLIRKNGSVPPFEMRRRKRERERKKKNIPRTI